jgi:hypothetical protein
MILFVFMGLFRKDNRYASLFSGALDQAAKDVSKEMRNRFDSPGFTGSCFDERINTKEETNK